MGRCVVPGCGNDSYATKRIKAYSLHQPKKGTILGKDAMKAKWWRWLKNCRRSMKCPKDRSFVICTEHFDIRFIKNYEKRLKLLNGGYKGSSIPGFELHPDAVPQYVSNRPLAEQLQALQLPPRRFIYSRPGEGVNEEESGIQICSGVGGLDDLPLELHLRRIEPLNSTMTETQSTPASKVLLGCSGCISTVKLDSIIRTLLQKLTNTEIRVILTEKSKHFTAQYDYEGKVQYFTDEDEWKGWKKIGDPVLHIELGKWADVMLIAPMSANSLSKVAIGICDNLLTCTIRAWNMDKPLLFAPAMDSKMWGHPITESHIKTLKNWGYRYIEPVPMDLTNGETGSGALGSVETIIAVCIEKLHESKESESGLSARKWSDIMVSAEDQTREENSSNNVAVKQEIC